MKSVNDWNLVESQTNSWPHYQWSPSDQCPVLPQDPVSASRWLQRRSSGWWQWWGGRRRLIVNLFPPSAHLSSTSPPHRTRRWLPEPLSVFTQLLRVLFCKIKLKLVKFVKIFSMFRSDFILVHHHHKLATYFQQLSCLSGQISSLPRPQG